MLLRKRLGDLCVQRSVLRKVPGRGDSQLEVKVMVPRTSGAWNVGTIGGAGQSHVELMTISILGIGDDLRYTRMKDQGFVKDCDLFHSRSNEFEGWHESSYDYLSRTIDTLIRHKSSIESHFYKCTCTCVLHYTCLHWNIIFI